MTSLVKTRWRFGARRHFAPHLLTLLGIEYRKVKGLDFWVANKEHLPRIYVEMQSEVRDKMRDLHPDTGGDAEEFKAFVDSYRSVKLQFVRHGANVAPVIIQSDVLTARSTVRRLGPGGFKYPSKAIAVMKLLRETRLSDPATARLIGSRWKAKWVRKVRRAMPEQPLCDCGRAANHRGWCKARARPESFHFRRSHSEATKVKLKKAWESKHCS